MGLGTGILLIAVGAVMKWGLTTERTSEFNLDTIGMILFMIGIVATLVSLAFWSSWGSAGVRRRTTTYDRQGGPVAGGPAYYQDGAVGAPQRTSVHEEVRDSRM